MKSIYKICFLIILVSFCLTNCTKEESLNSKELIAYIKSNNDNNVNLTIPFYNERTNWIQNVPISAFLTRSTSVDVGLTIDSDSSLVSNFNNFYKTSYKVLPHNNFRLFSSNTIGIHKDDVSATDSIKIEFFNIKDLNTDFKYLLPLSIKSIDSKDKGIAISSNFKTVYVVIDFIHTIVDPSNLPLSSKYLDRKNWTVTTSGSWTINTIDKILDNNNATNWDSNGVLPSWIELDMKKVEKVSGFTIVPNYQFEPDDFIVMEILSSEDGKNWNKIGVYTGTPTDPNSSASKPDLKTVRFFEPVSSRYFKFNIIKTTDGRYAGMAELYANE